MMPESTNYAKAIKEAYIKKNKSAKTGNEYYTLELGFINGYKQRVFLDDAQRFAIADSASTMQANETIDNF